MAETILQTRIISKHVTLDQANTGNWKPYEGEIVLARVDTQKPDGHGGVTVVPTYLMKVGAKNAEGNLIAIKDLQWTHAPASDVYAWAKQQRLGISDNEVGNVITGIEATDTGITIHRASVATSESYENVLGDIDALQKALAKEVTDRGEADTALDNKITAINDSLNGTTEGTIGKKIADAQADATQALADASANKTAHDNYVTSNNAAVALKADQTTVDALDAAYKAEDSKIRGEFAEADTALHTTISGEIATAKGEAIAEATRLDGEQYTKITGEYTAAIGTAQSTLQGNINTLSGTVEANESANSTAHAGFTSAIEALQAKVANVSNVMDFVGIASSVSVDKDTGVITITVEGVSSFQDGDVVVSEDGKEFVYANGAWHEFGYADDTEAAVANLKEAFELFRDTTAPATYATQTALGAETTARTTAINDLDAAYKKADADLKTELTTAIGTAKGEAYDDAVAEAARLDGLQTAAIETAYKAHVAEEIGKVTEAQTAVDSAQNTKITALEDEVNGKGDVVGLRAAINAEALRADAAEKVNAAAIKAISDDYLKAADKTELANATTAVAEDLADLEDVVEANKLDVDTNFVKMVGNNLTVGGNVIIFDCGGVEEA